VPSGVFKTLAIRKVLQAKVSGRRRKLFVLTSCLLISFGCQLGPLAFKYADINTIPSGSDVAYRTRLQISASLATIQLGGGRSGSLHFRFPLFSDPIPKVPPRLTAEPAGGGACKTPVGLPLPWWIGLGCGFVPRLRTP
jgi:hypothetical protein